MKKYFEVLQAKLAGVPLIHKVTLPKLLFGIWITSCVYLIYIYIPTDPNTSNQSYGANTRSLQSDSQDEESCNIAGVYVHGALVTYLPDGFADYQARDASDKDYTPSEVIVSKLDTIQTKPQYKAIVLEIDSGGGNAVAGEEIASAVKRSKLPVIGLIRGTGASAAYWAVSTAKPIFASQNSDVGSIGVTASYLQNVSKDTKFVELAVGRFKDLGNPNKNLTQEERALIYRDMGIIHENFIRAVSENRGIAYEAVKKIADGSTVLGGRAKELHLIDSIGTFSDVRAYIQDTLHVESPSMCWI